MGLHYDGVRKFFRALTSLHRGMGHSSELEDRYPDDVEAR
jgi:hypothetical protein